MNPVYEALTIIFVLVLVCIGALAITQGIFTAQGVPKKLKNANTPCTYVLVLSSLFWVSRIKWKIRGKTMTEQFFGQCEYCEEWLHGLRIHDTEQFGELELCKDCRELADNSELEECMCGALASRDGHTYCRDCE